MFIKNFVESYSNFATQNLKDDYLKDNYVEGIVFWKDGKPQCKIKRSDFGFEWGNK